MVHNKVHEEALMKFAEDAITGATAESIEFIEDVEDDEELSLWLVTMEDGEEYWLLEEDSPCALYKRGGIYEDRSRVIDVYKIMQERGEEKPIKDRFAYDYVEE